MKLRAREVVKKIRKQGFNARRYRSSERVMIQVRLGKTSRSITSPLPKHSEDHKSFVAFMVRKAAEYKNDPAAYESLPDVTMEEEK